MNRQRTHRTHRQRNKAARDGHCISQAHDGLTGAINSSVNRVPHAAGVGQDELQFANVAGFTWRIELEADCARSRRGVDGRDQREHLGGRIGVNVSRDFQTATARGQQADDREVTRSDPHTEDSVPSPQLRVRSLQQTNRFPGTPA